MWSKIKIIPDDNKINKKQIYINLVVDGYIIYNIYIYKTLT